eukprot:CAMPEP_0196997320 /NCGR_PEP_ID=MMETSP1380-20130617/2964_1 /TAXON_ID=5936 /ORGANISM="Euplotes crassus, Strain CT5" /LENGTH=213 /DNA_ID=CAMNT_0042413517 /DNA_START=584 /DNA_END=1226 /DNA_ORIENTATION=+
MKEVGKEWQSIKPEDKKQYQALADQDKKDINKELKEFEKEVEKLQVGKPTKSKRNGHNKKKPESTNEETPEKEDKQELKRKCLEGEVAELKKIPNDSSNNKEEEKNRTTLPDDSPPQYKNPIELKPRRVARPTPMLSPIIPKKETDVKNSKSASSIAQPREEPVQKPVKVLKINHKEILAPRATFPTMKKASMGYRMIKEPNPVQPTMTSPSD